MTIERNTNDNGSRNGIGAFRRTARKIGQINKGLCSMGTRREVSVAAFLR